MVYDIIIIGGGVSGMSAAITLGSAQEKFDWASEKKILVIDAGKSDLQAASLWNAPGVPIGKDGKELLADLQTQLDRYETVEKMNDGVTSLTQDDQGVFAVTTGEQTYRATAVVLASGFHQFEVETSLVASTTHPKVARPGMIMLENNEGVISKNLYVTGVAAGLPSMFAIASGDGVRVACEILAEWGGNFFVPHDLAQKG